jgi:hypothetical protein
MKRYIKSASEIFASSFNRAIEHMNETQCCFITAFRYKDSDGNILSKNQKRSRNKQLEADIKRSNLTYIKALGGFVENKGTPDEAEVTEDTFCVINNQYSPEDFKRLMCYLCRKYEQDSILITEPKHEVRVDSRGKKQQLPEVIDVIGRYYRGDGSIEYEFHKATIKDADEYFTKMFGKYFVLSATTFDTEDVDIYSVSGRILAIHYFREKYPDLD